NFNLPAISGLGASIKLIKSVGISNIQEHCYKLGDTLIDGLDKLSVDLVGPRDRSQRSPHIYVAALPPDTWVEYLAAHGIRVSPERDGIRISLAMFNNDDDIDRF